MGVMESHGVFVVHGTGKKKTTENREIKKGENNYLLQESSRFKFHFLDTWASAHFWSCFNSGKQGKLYWGKKSGIISQHLLF